MKKRTTKKTITLLIGDDPSHVICPGHVDIKEFNQASGNEGWNDGKGLGYKKDNLSYIYAYISNKSVKGFKFNRCSPSHLKAKKFTIVNWD